MKAKVILAEALAAVLAALAGVATAAEPLAPQAMEPLPIGSVMPRGWLKFQLDRMTEGLVGRLYETSEFLTPSNGWLRADGIGWEEQPYWFRSFVKLAVLTRNARCLDVSREWVEKILATRDADGWFGPAGLKAHRFENGMVLSDVWGHMVMTEALWSWWEHTGDARVMRLVEDFYRFCARMPSGRFIAPEGAGPWPRDWHWHFHIQAARAGDPLPLLFRLYGRTRDAAFLAVADRLMGKCIPPGRMFLDNHTVNFAQRLPYWTVYSRRTGVETDRGSADYWYDLHMQMWGQMPRGAFAADENVRIGCTDPRQGTESCTWGEFVRSFNRLGEVTGEAKWADRIEDVVFNHAPCAYTPDWRELHYITAPNQVNLDAASDHNYNNRAPQAAYSSVIYRCCRHNAALTFPAFTENLVKRAADGALVFWTYAPHEGRSSAGGGNVGWTLDTRYPFRETATLSVEAEKPFVARFRVPGWAKAFSAGGHAAAQGARYLDVRLPAGRSTLALAMRADCAYTFWPRSGGVTVDRGPLSYSLAIGERYGRVRRPNLQGGAVDWGESDLRRKSPQDFMTEVLPTTPWNFGLDVSQGLAFRELPWTDDCLVASNAVCEIIATGRRLPAWTLQDNQPAELQRSPAYTSARPEKLRFVPLGCQRLRLSVLPQVTDDETLGTRWRSVPPRTERAKRPPALAQ